MKIAILIGVSQYQFVESLPACTMDVGLMKRLLDCTKKYDHIESITTQTDSASVKEKVRKFFKEFEGSSEIEEALVYFSGHGVFNGDALLCCSDFDHKRPATTSISNDELDDLLRSVNPRVAVKIVDACQSGSPYIKDTDASFEKSLTSSKLKSFICMSSSRQDQSSYASAEGSFFTSKWIDAALEKDDGVVLYRDIQASLADAFVCSSKQTPFFVTQGNGLEVFTDINEQMRQFKTQRSQSMVASIVDLSSNNLIELIVQEVDRHDRSYISQDEAVKVIEQAKQDLQDQSPSLDLVNTFYKTDISSEMKLKDLPSLRQVAQFAEEKGWEKSYFVKIISKDVKETVLKNPLAKLFQFFPLGDDDYVIQTRKRPTQLETTHVLGIEVAEIHFLTKGHPSLKEFILYIGIVHSPVDVIVLSAIVQMIQKGWNERGPDLSAITWKQKSYPWGDLVDNPKLLWEGPFTEAQDQIKSYLESLVPKKEETNAVEDQENPDNPQSPS